MLFSATKNSNGRLSENPDDESFRTVDGQGFKEGVKETLGNVKKWTHRKNGNLIGSKSDITSKTAEQREQLKNFVVRHCVGEIKLKVTAINLSVGLCQGTDMGAVCRLDRKSIDSLLITLVIMSHICASKFFEK